ncbi:MAG: dTDP-glucose 4,6-dehydratase [Syntrophotaleaceae bacterium]
MEKILVTGGCGFIGSNFIRLTLAAFPEAQIINLDKLTYAGNAHNLTDVASDPRYCFYNGDICDAELVDKIFCDEGINTVVHFAAESHVDRSISSPAAFIQTNVVGTFTLLEAARKAWSGKGEKCRFLHVSTDEVYGSLGEAGLFSELTPYDPRSPYSASKASSDHLVRAYHHTYDLPVLITNCSNNYGPYQFPEKLIPLMINNASHGKELPVYGDGGNIRDWLFVGDHCEALLTVLKRGMIGRTYNIGGDCEKLNIEVVRRICDLIDEMAGPLPSGKRRQDLIRFVEDRFGHDRRYAIDAGRIKSELGWEPSVTFDEGLRMTVKWYLDNRSWYKAILNGSCGPNSEQLFAAL